MFKKTTLDNGLRIITAPMPQVESVSVAIFVGAGARYENETNSGISHFLEHLVFKGSKKYPSHLKVTKTIEGLGGVTNAATDTEATFFWVKSLKQDYKKALDVLFDIVLKPNLRAEDINRERGVILEEINRYEDLPEVRVWDVFIQTVWPSNPLGQRVLGEAKVIKRLRREDFIRYREKLYVPSNLVVVGAGQLSHQELQAVVEKYFSALKKRDSLASQTVKFTQKSPQLGLHYKKTEQAHLMLGVQGLHGGHPDRFSLSVLSAYLGEGLSSRLFVKIREEKGLCYYIRSFVELYKDSGLFGVHAGLNLKNLEKAIEEILRQLKLVKKNGISQEELKEAKNKIKGPLLYKLESTDGVVGYLGGQELLTSEILTPEQVAERVDAVGVDDIIKVSKELFVNERLNLSIIGPFDNSQKFIDLLSFEV